MLISVELKQQLDDYVALLPIVRLIHLQERIGVVRARQHGASLAVADVLIFFDSHCECTPGNACSLQLFCWFMQRHKSYETN